MSKKSDRQCIDGRGGPIAEVWGLNQFQDGLMSRTNVEVDQFQSCPNVEVEPMLRWTNVQSAC